MQGAQASFLPDGRRLHLYHGPIDLIIEVFGSGRASAYQRCIAGFEGLLDCMVKDLTVLRARLNAQSRTPNLSSPLSSHMVRATQPFADRFVTPMAAVAGAVADHMLELICEDAEITKAYVNNGGDIAFHLSGEARLTTALAGVGATVKLGADSRCRGIATSGWRGRSHSLGIADQVTALAASAAQADVAATLIANAVDLPLNTGILRRPACELAPDSDLGTRAVTVHVPPLSLSDVQCALERGAALARNYQQRGLIHAAYLSLQDLALDIGAPDAPPLELETCHA